MASVVPVADRSIIPMVTAPVAVTFAVAADTNVPFVLVNVVTPAPPASSAIQSDPSKKRISEEEVL